MEPSSVPGDYRPDKSCGKTFYPTKKDAITAAHWIVSRASSRRRRGRVQKLRAYPCPDCHGWHLTKRL